MAELPDQPETLDAISSRYSLILCDVWGVVHNGVRAYPQASAALRGMRERGLAVVLITNAPRPHGLIEAGLESLGVRRDVWDRVVTSGDVTRRLIEAGPKRVFHLGPKRYLPIFEGIDVDLVPETEASGVVCTGLFDDETETPADYADMLLRFNNRDLPLVCANPDIVVERGDRLIWCAGALARDFAELGGRTLVAGKPHEPIYKEALTQASEVLGRPITRRETLAIGDGIANRRERGGRQRNRRSLYIGRNPCWRLRAGRRSRSRSSFHLPANP